MALLPIGKTRLLPGGAQARYQLTLRLPAGAAAPDLFGLFLDGNGRLGGDANLVFFNQPVHPRGAAARQSLQAAARFHGFSHRPGNTV